MKTAVRIFALTALVTLLAAFAVGCRDTQAPVSSNTERNAASSPDTKQPGGTSDPAKSSPGTLEPNTIAVTLYFGDEEGEGLVAEARELPETTSPHKGAIEALIEGPKVAGHTKTIPAEAKVLNLDVIKGVAYVNFSEEFVNKHWGGGTGELLTVNSIVNTLTEFEGIQKVQIMVEGTTVETLAGHMDLSQPLTRDESIIKK